MENCSKLLADSRAEFDKALRDLHEQGVAYDPRDAQARIPYGNAGKLARKAHGLWERLEELERECEWYRGEMKRDADRIQEESGRDFENMNIAQREHVTYMAAIRRYVLRWRFRIAGKTVLFGVRWKRKALTNKATAAPRVEERNVWRWHKIQVTALTGLERLRLAMGTWGGL